RGYFCHNWLIIIAYPDKKPGCRFAPFAFPMKTGMSLRSICNFAYLLICVFEQKIDGQLVIQILASSKLRKTN
ncbi:MAG: hypothetical protein LH618_19435, partial [Saprospiraceae bacterium]|nr:hypothetical protein [Saprospiraceae bacterium]